MGQKVVVDGIKGECQRSAIAVGAKSHIYPKDQPFGCRGLQDINQGLTQFDEELMVADGLCPVGRSVFPVSENQIDIRRHIEFTPAELAETQNRQLHRLAAVLADRLSKPVNEFEVGAFQCRVNGCIGQGGQGLQYF